MEQAVEPRTAGWVSECKNILETILADPCSAHFLHAQENPVEYSEYIYRILYYFYCDYNFIFEELDAVFEDFPDLSTISDKLSAGEYNTPKVPYFDTPSKFDQLLSGLEDSR